MYYRLREGLAFCIIDGAAIFLDLPRDRYFRLPPQLDAAFARWSAGEVSNDAVGPPLAAAGVLVVHPPGAPCDKMARHQVHSCHPAIIAGPFDLPELARALWMQRRLERRLRRLGLEQTLSELRELKCRAAGFELHQAPKALAVLRAFEIARLVRPSADKCLPRSMAVVLCLARHGVRANVVLGVKLGPFAAHAWACAGDALLNDTVEEVARFTPILVV